MNLAGLDFDNIPPFAVPMRFYVTACLFGLVTSIFIFISGESIWLTRWHPSTLALTHLVALGIISMIMCGSLLQMLPVLAGVVFPFANITGGLTLLALSGATIMLAIGFYLSEFLLLKLALALFILVIAGFIGTVLWLIRYRLKASFSINTMRLALISLIVLLLIAGFMLADYFFSTQFNLTKELTDSHASWGLVGWVTLMIIGVSFQVLPMFHVAPSFPTWCERYLPLTLFVSLCAQLIFAIVLPLMSVSQTTQFVLVNANVYIIQLLLFVYAATGVISLLKRKRKIADVSVNLWLVAFSLLAVCMVIVIVPGIEGLLLQYGFSAIGLASLFIFGWIMSVIMAMLLKIAPFLAYLHLQKQCGLSMTAFTLLPNMHEILAKKWMRYLLVSHAISLLALCLTIFNPQFYWLFSMAVGGQFTYLLILLVSIMMKYRRLSLAISQTIASDQSIGKKA